MKKKIIPLLALTAFAGIAHAQVDAGALQSAFTEQINTFPLQEYARLSYNNYGSRITGQSQARADVSITGNDKLNFTKSAGADFASGSLNLFSYKDFDFDAIASYLKYKEVSNYAMSGAEGNAVNYGLRVSKKITEKSLAFAGIERSEYKNSNNIINETISDYSINKVSAGINGTNYLDLAYVSWGATATLGSLSINNTNQANNDTQGAATAGSFAKLGFNGSINQPLPIGKTNLVASIYGQLANKNLNSAEQIYMGGPYGVRAYPVAQGGGAQGAIASVEVNHTPVQDLQVGVFFDTGVVQQYKNAYPYWQGLTNANNTYSLKGAGFALAYTPLKDIRIDGSVAWRVGRNPLYNAQGQQVNVDGLETIPTVFVNASYAFE